MKRKTEIIVNGDDFGLTKSCTDAILQSYLRGNISSTTMMATGESFDYACQLLANNDTQHINIGVHFNLTEGKPLTKRITECHNLVSGGEFTKYLRSYRYHRLSPLEIESIRDELCAQVDKIKSAGITIDHADSHQHIHMNLNMTDIILSVCKEKGIPAIRNKKTANLDFLHEVDVRLFCLKIKKYGLVTTNFFGNAMEFESISKDGIYEIMVHPDYDFNGEIINRKTGTLNQPKGDSLDDQLKSLLGDGYSLTSYSSLVGAK